MFHPAVCLEQIRYFFTIDAWEKLKYYVHSKSVHLEFSCRSCNKSDENSNDLISCEHCLKYFHISCARLKKNVKKRQPWFCPVCKAQERLETKKSTEESNRNFLWNFYIYKLILLFVILLYLRFVLLHDIPPSENFFPDCQFRFIFVGHLYSTANLLFHW